MVKNPHLCLAKWGFFSYLHLDISILLVILVDFKSTNMKEIVEKIAEAYASFTKDASSNIEGNKAAGTRARKASLEESKK